MSNVLPQFFSFSSFDIPSSPLHFPPPPNFPVGSLSIGINEPCLVTARPDDHILNVGRDISRYFYDHIWGEKLKNIHHFHQPAVKYAVMPAHVLDLLGAKFCVCSLYTDWHVACRASWTSDRRKATVKCVSFLLLCKKTIHLSKESGSKKGHFTNHMRKCFDGLFFKVGLFPFKYFQTKAKMLFKATFISQLIQLNAGNNIV